MLNVLKKVFKWLLYLISIPLLYVLASMVLTWISVNDYNAEEVHEHYIYLNTNGVHLDMVIPQKFLQEELKSGLKNIERANYVSFGWGDEKFYLETPSWSDLTFKTAFTAMFLKSSTLMHVTSYTNMYNDWVKIYVSEEEMGALQLQINNSFEVDTVSAKLLLSDKGYSHNDEFYRANGSYSLLNTCNSWVNSVFKNSGLKSCMWTPFDFGLMSKYE